MPETPVAFNVPTPACLRRTIARALLREPKGIRLALLAVWDQKARETADLALLREIRAVQGRLLDMRRRGVPV